MTALNLVILQQPLLQQPLPRRPLPRQPPHQQAWQVANRLEVDLPLQTPLVILMLFSVVLTAEEGTSLLQALLLSTAAFRFAIRQQGV